MEILSPAGAGASSCRPLPADPYLVRIRDFVSERTRLYFAGHKKGVLRQRLDGRLQQLGLADYRSYWQHLLHDPGEGELLFDRLTTNETSFFRNPQQFAYLREVVLPGLEPARGEESLPPLTPGGFAAPREKRKLRILSAGCSTGEEPYSAAMTVLEGLPDAAGWDIRIVAGDLSQRCLDTARAGYYDLSRLKGIAPGLREKYLTTLEGGAVIGEELRSIVEFHPLNLNDLMQGGSPPGLDPSSAGFDIVFCRNVMIYFSPSSQQLLVETLYRLLAPGGYLLTGDAEPLHLFRHDFVAVRDAGCLIYKKPNGES